MMNSSGDDTHSATPDQGLARHITVVLVVKVLLLLALWLVFVRPQWVSVDSEQAAARMGLAGAAHLTAPGRTP